MRSHVAGCPQSAQAGRVNRGAMMLTRPGLLAQTAVTLTCGIVYCGCGGIECRPAELHYCDEAFLLERAGIAAVRGTACPGRSGELRCYAITRGLRSRRRQASCSRALHWHGDGGGAAAHLH